ncbi:Mannose-1-phosphate guanyltransferase beta isoform 1 [Schistosoma japonicum]|nr:Mannose-1-phosphate guanyltransferase beta isoform 1 [Schistosoma japonicum]
MLEFHLSHGREGTMAVTKVEEPSKYGAVVHNDQTGLVKRFVEKPSEYIANRVNAGLYIFEPSILKRIEAKPLSIETAVFPEMVRDSALYCIEFSGFWMDIGQPADYLTGMRLYLGHLFECNSPLLTVDPKFIGNVLVHETAKIGRGCRIGPNVTIGADVIIEDGVRISNSAIFSKSIIRSHSWLNNCIVGWRSVVGKWVRIENVTVLGEDVSVKDELFLNGALVLPHNSISQSVPEPHIIM